MRVYSAKTMREVAVLKWHGEGCYATTFAVVRESSPGTERGGEGEGEGEGKGAEGGAGRELVSLEKEVGNAGDDSTTLIAGIRDEERGTMSTIQQRRDLKVQTTHWLAAGSKDGKVSLWDIY